jgi:hypothetical protein
MDNRGFAPSLADPDDPCAVSESGSPASTEPDLTAGTREAPAPPRREDEVRSGYWHPCYGWLSWNDILSVRGYHVC